jgi:uncharacterized membrane protein
MTKRAKKFAVAGAMGGIILFLGAARLGFIPWAAGAYLTVLHVPVIIGAVLEGPLVGAAVGLTFGGFSLLQASVAPAVPTDAWFTNPLVSIAPRLFIGPIAWLAYRASRRWFEAPSFAVSGVAGSIANTVLVLGVIEAFTYLRPENGFRIFLPWQAAGKMAAVNGLAEAALAGFLTFVVVALWKRVADRRTGSRI